MLTQNITLTPSSKIVNVVVVVCVRGELIFLMLPISLILPYIKYIIVKESLAKFCASRACPLHQNDIHVGRWVENCTGSQAGDQRKPHTAVHQLKIRRPKLQISSVCHHTLPSKTSWTPTLLIHKRQARILFFIQGHFKCTL